MNNTLHIKSVSLMHKSWMKGMEVWNNMRVRKNDQFSVFRKNCSVFLIWVSVILMLTGNLNL